MNYTVQEKIADGEYRVMCESPGIVGNHVFLWYHVGRTDICVPNPCYLRPAHAGDRIHLFADIRPADMIPKENVCKWYESIKDTAPKEVRDWLEAVFHAAKEKKLTTGGTVLLTAHSIDGSPPHIYHARDVQ